MLLCATCFGLLPEGSQIYNLVTLELDTDLDRVNYICFYIFKNILNIGNLIHIML